MSKSSGNLGATWRRPELSGNLGATRAGSKSSGNLGATGRGSESSGNLGATGWKFESSGNLGVTGGVPLTAGNLGSADRDVLPESEVSVHCNSGIDTKRGDICGMISSWQVLLLHRTSPRSLGGERISDQIGIRALDSNNPQWGSCSEAKGGQGRSGPRGEVE